MNITGAFSFTIHVQDGTPALNGNYFNNDRSNYQAAPFPENATRVAGYNNDWLCGEYDTTWFERSSTQRGLLRIRQLSGVTNRYELDWFDASGQWIFTGAAMLNQLELWGYYSGVRDLVGL